MLEKRERKPIESPEKDKVMKSNKKYNKGKRRNETT